MSKSDCNATLTGQTVIRLWVLDQKLIETSHFQQSSLNLGVLMLFEV